MSLVSCFKTKSLYFKSLLNAGYAFVRFQTSEMAAAAVDASARGALCLRNSRVRAAWAKKDSEPKGAGAGSRKSSLDSFNAEFWGSSSFWGNQS